MSRHHPKPPLSTHSSPNSSSQQTPPTPSNKHTHTPQTVDDPEFWDGLRPLEFGSLPRLQDEVAVVGYPVGGESISITAGVVSRIEVRFRPRVCARRAAAFVRLCVSNARPNPPSSSLARRPHWPPNNNTITSTDQVTEYSHGSHDLLGIQIDAVRGGAEGERSEGEREI